MINNPILLHPDFCLFGTPHNQESLKKQARQWQTTGSVFEQQCAAFIQEWLNDKPYIMVQTSGTTGIPKKVQLSKQAMVHSAQATAAFFLLQPHHKILCCLPTQYIAGKMMLVRAMVLGLNLDLQQPTTTPLQNNHNTYDFVAMVPLQVQNSISQLGQIKQLIIGGAPLEPMLAKKIQTTTCQAFETYSMTETITHIALKPVGQSRFTLLPNITISTTPQQCLQISAPLLNPNPIITNDVVKIHNAEQFTWLGRIDNVINSGGIKLFPEKIEQKLAQKISRRFFITSQADLQLGQKVILIIEGPTIQLSSEIFNELDPYEKPKAIYFVPKFIETETQKIKRSETLVLIKKNK